MHGEIKGDSLNICTKPKGIHFSEIDLNDFDNLSMMEEKTFVYEPTETRKIFIIDLETGKEVDSVMVWDGKKRVRICTINVGRKYFAFEYRLQEKRTIACGMCKLESISGDARTEPCTIASDNAGIIIIAIINHTANNKIKFFFNNVIILLINFMFTPSYFFYL